MTAHVQWHRNSVMTYDVRNEWFIILNKVLYKCVSCHYSKTILSLCNCEVEQDNLPPVLVSDSQPQATRFGCGEGHFSVYRHCGLYVYLSRNWKILTLLLKTNKETVGEWLLCANSEKLYICAVCACKKKKNPIWKLWHINAHINPITLFSIHVNTTFRFINRNEFSPIEPKIVHVNVANEKIWFFCCQLV